MRKYLLPLESFDFTECIQSSFHFFFKNNSHEISTTSLLEIIVLRHLSLTNRSFLSESMLGVTDVMELQGRFMMYELKLKQAKL